MSNFQFEGTYGVNRIGNRLHQDFWANNTIGVVATSFIKIGSGQQRRKIRLQFRKTQTSFTLDDYKHKSYMFSRFTIFNNHAGHLILTNLRS